MRALVLSNPMILQDRNGDAYRSWAADPLLDLVWNALGELAIQGAPTLIDWLLSI